MRSRPEAANWTADTNLISQVLHEQRLDEAYHSNGRLERPHARPPVDPEEGPEVDGPVVGVLVELAKRLLGSQATGGGHVRKGLVGARRLARGRTAVALLGRLVFVVVVVV